MRRLRGAIGMGVAWALGWALAGLLIGVTSRVTPGLPWDAFFDVFDAPLPALAVPGFVGGAIYSIVLGIAARRRRFDELSLSRVATWGAIGGVLLSLVPATMNAVGLATLDPAAGVSHLTAVIAIPLIALSTASATVTFALARQHHPDESAASVS
jgi:hypothetical protein